ncbi:LamB/YcsF family protein [Sediminibacillus albus]|uniref:5-oxoprolinase subunit A n=1 Tax=Sediminibacillus albus TaxID=407036 RepID=A0A1G8YKQ2_9BACI|nr:5-oxoprolinase subunit PxpA [Sediminibacillus albus]SDK02745.1 UPF0271 protein [Sediminibacillus albus]
MFTADLNCDMGESYGPYTLGSDKQLIPFISSANIACGYHAGDPQIMEETVKLAIDNQVKIGAHPGFPDLNGFGRRFLQVTPKQAYQMVIYQIGALSGFVHAAKASLSHVKPHGALYNIAAQDKEIARAIAQAIADYNPDLTLYGLANSELTKAGERIGLKVAHEVFADRTYQDDGSLTPRDQPHALLPDEQSAVIQVIDMLKTGTVATVQGARIPIKADTICIHGDSPYAAAFVRRIHQRFAEEGIHLNKNNS